ncbi:MAG: hypothetical protein ABIJ14_01060 [Nanoarchaeota archaeon]
MDKKELSKILKNKRSLERKTSFYLKRKILLKQKFSLGEIQGHAQKAEHNLNFIKDLSSKYSDWIIVGCYYACYHIALSLILKKGYSSKNHDATLCVLIKEYYSLLGQENIELLNRIYLDNQDILFYANSKEEREKASYSTKIIFGNIDSLIKGTRFFVNKCKEIIKNEK